jgi:TolB-like protein/Tfp pilus assembly protein PilF
MWYRSTRDLEAWGYVVRGLSIFYYYTKEAMAKSRELFEQALEIDPENAHALTMLAWTHFIDTRFGYTDSREESLKRAVELAKKALSMDDNQSLVHSLWQHIYLVQRQHDKAVEEGRKAIALGPNDAEVHILFGEALFYSGMSEESVQMCEKAMRLHPHTPLYYFGTTMNAYYGARRYDESLAMAEQLIERSRKVKYERGVSWGQWGSALALMELGRESQGRRIVDQAVREWPQSSNLDYVRKYSSWAFYKDPDNLQHILDTLRKAGLPETPPLPLPDKPSIAVLPFVNMSGDPEQEYIGDGISEEIINALSKISKLFVIARESSFSYKGKQVNVPQIARELGVRYILDRVRITAQLIDGIKGQHLWSERYERVLKDIFALQDEITMKIITELRVKLTAGEQARMWAKKDKNLNVHLKHLEAISLWNKGTREGYIRHGQLAQQIINMAPESDTGYRLLAWNHWVLARGGKSPRENMLKAFKLAKKVLSIDESDPISHALLGSLYLAMRKYDQAIAAGERSVELDPNGAMVHALLGMTLNYAGRPDEAIAYLKQGIRLNPFPAFWYFAHLGNCYMQKGQYENALTEFKRALHRSPDAPISHLRLAITYILLNQQEEARAEANKVLEIDPNFSVERVSKTLLWKNPAFNKLIVEAMRTAGLK